jgi:hypothetical protein
MKARLDEIMRNDPEKRVNFVYLQAKVMLAQPSGSL